MIKLNQIPNGIQIDRPTVVFASKVFGSLNNGGHYIYPNAASIWRKENENTLTLVDGDIKTDINLSFACNAFAAGYNIKSPDLELIK